MTPVNGIKPTKKTKTSKERTIILKEIGEKKEVEKRVIRPTKKEKELPHHYRRNLMWIIVIIVMLLIIIGWVFLFNENLLFSKTNTKSTGWEKVKSSFSELFETIREDVFKIKTKKPASNINSYEEQIKELEEKVFPQFKNE